jgi:hypothetical protein
MGETRWTRTEALPVRVLWLDFESPTAGDDIANYMNRLYPLCSGLRPDDCHGVESHAATYFRHPQSWWGRSALGRAPVSGCTALAGCNNPLGKGEFSFW